MPFYYPRIETHHPPLCSPLQQEKYEFFAPIWRVMRDDPMPVAEVRRQVGYVALAVAQGSQVSDMRHHAFSGKLQVDLHNSLCQDVNMNGHTFASALQAGSPLS